MLLALLLMQTVSGPPGDDPAPVVQTCRRGGDELVVCARTQTDRLHPLAEPARGAPMTVRIGSNATAHVAATGFVRDAIPDNRILAHLKVAF